MSATYDADVIAWANEQAAFLRAGNYAALDIEHIADEVEDVGKSEERELASRMTVLIAHMMKWKFQPERRGNSWRLTISVQRKAIERRLTKMPSLKSELNDPEWLEIVWGDAATQASRETNLVDFPEQLPWTLDQIRDPDFLPE